MTFPRSSARRLAAAALLPLLAACEPGVLDPVGPVAGGERTILINSLGIMLAIVLPTMALTVAFAWWFRAGNARARRRPDFTYSGQLELLVWSIPLLVIVFLGGIAWVGSHDLDPPRGLAASGPAGGAAAAAPAPLRVDVVSLDWKWLFVYPDQGIASVNRLVLPVGRPVQFHVTSATVMNSFFVPRLGSQIYAMSGMENKVNLRADRLGTYRGISAHYSGEGFANMQFAVDVVPAAGFAGFVAGARAAGPVLNGASYRALGERPGNVPPFTYRAVPTRFMAAALKLPLVPFKQVKDGREQRVDVK